MIRSEQVHAQRDVGDSAPRPARARWRFWSRDCQSGSRNILGLEGEIESEVWVQDKNEGTKARREW